MHSYNSPGPLVSTDVTAIDQLQVCDQLFTLPTVQGVQGFNKNFKSDTQLSIPLTPDGKTRPPILVVDNELPSTNPFLVEPVKGGRFKLYANHANHQEYAGHYYDFEVGYFLKHWPRPPAPSVAEFMAVAEQVVSRGYVPPSQMSVEQIQVLKGGLDVRPLN
ncbi:MAG: hypothetical protein AAF959_04595 [Cyanobacteria bacterium P01_D01_bin.56]